MSWVSVTRAAGLLLAGAFAITLVPEGAASGDVNEYDSHSNSKIVPSGFVTNATSDFSVAAVGDWGCNMNTLATIDNIKSKSPDVVIALGDLSYSTNFNCWLEETSELEPVMHIVVGNHDGGLSDNPTAVKDLPQLLDHFMVKNQYYSFDYRSVHFTVISTELPYTVGSDQYRFIDQDLAHADENSTINWKIVAFHKPAYVSPGGHAPLTSLRDALHPLFDKYHVDLVLQGHVHNYQRSLPLQYNAALPSNPNITNVERSSYDNGYTGEIWIVAGTGGASSHTLSIQSSFVAKQYDKVFGFLNLEFAENGTTLAAKFYSNDGRVLDSFEVKKPLQSNHMVVDRATTLTIDGKDYSISYGLTNALLQNTTLDRDTKSLGIFLEGGHKAGELEISLGREVIDSKADNGADISYSVLIDDSSANFNETQTSDKMRHLVVPFGEDAKEIKIIGTRAVPELPPAILEIVFCIMMMAVVGISAEWIKARSGH